MKEEFVGEKIGDNPYYAGPDGINFIQMGDDIKVRLSSANVLSLAKDAVEKIKKPYHKFSAWLVESKKEVEKPVEEEKVEESKLERNKKTLKDAMEKMNSLQAKQTELTDLMKKAKEDGKDEKHKELEEEYNTSMKMMGRYHEVVVELQSEIAKLKPKKDEEKKIDPPETPSYNEKYEKIETLVKNKTIQSNKPELTETEKEKLLRDLNMIDDKIRMTEQVLIKESKLNTKILDHDLNDIVKSLRDKRSKLVFSDNSNHDNIARITDIDTKLAALEGFQEKQKNLYDQLVKTEKLREKNKVIAPKEEKPVEKEEVITPKEEKPVEKEETDLSKIEKERQTVLEQKNRMFEQDRLRKPEEYDEVNEHLASLDSRIANARRSGETRTEMSEDDKVTQLIEQRRKLLEKKDRLHDIDSTAYSNVLREIALIEDNIPSFPMHESRIARSQYASEMDNQGDFRDSVMQGVEEMRKNMHANIDRDMDGLVETLNKMFEKQMGNSKKY